MNAVVFVLASFVCVLTRPPRSLCRRADAATSLAAIAQALRLDDAQRTALVQAGAHVKAQQGGLLRSIARFPVRLLRGGENSPSQGNQRAGAAAGGQHAGGKVSIAKDWVHFLTEEAERGTQSAQGERETIPSGAPPSLGATPRAAGSSVHTPASAVLAEEAAQAAT
jgi:hypothetical protein